MTLRSALAEKAEERGAQQQQEGPLGRSFSERYSLGRALGSGAFGEVWECRSREGGEGPEARLACKVVQKAQLSQQGLGAVRAEAELMRGLAGQHRGLVQLREALETPRAVQLVMELCRGGDLFDLVSARGPLPEASARLIFRQLASALAFLHSRGIAHRDIKPENILFLHPPLALFPASSHPTGSRGDKACPSGEAEAVVAKLADLGLAVKLRPGETTTGYVGSPYYMAPEVVQGRAYGRRVDVWSLGVVLCVMLTRKLPFAGRGSGDREGLRRAILRARVEWDQPCWQGVSQEAKDLISQMLQPDPRHRLRASELLSHSWCREGEGAADHAELPCTSALSLSRTEEGVEPRLLRAGEDKGARSAEARCGAAPQSRQGPAWENVVRMDPMGTEEDACIIEAEGDLLVLPPAVVHRDPSTSSQSPKSPQAMTPSRRRFSLLNLPSFRRALVA